MSRDGNGTYSLPEAAFVYDTVIDEVAVNSNFSDIAAAITASISKDGQTAPTANLPMGAYRHTSVGNASARDQYAAMGQVQDGSGIWCGTAGGTADALTLTPSPAITAYGAGQRFEFKAGGSANTGAVTFAISGLTTIAGQVNGVACVAGDIAANQWYRITLSDASTAQIERIGAPASSGGDFLANGTVPMTGNLQLGAGVSAVFEGATDNGFETTLTAADPTADRTLTLPDATGTILTSADVGTTANKIVQLDSSAKLPAVDGSALTNLPSSGGGGVTFKNLLIGGDFSTNPWQRGTSGAVGYGMAYTYSADRWYGLCESFSAGQMTVSRQADAPAYSDFNTAGVATQYVAATKCAQIQTTTAGTTGNANAIAHWRQAIEGLNAAQLGWGSANAKSVTLSFWVKSSLTGTHSAYVQNSSQNRTCPVNFTINAANTWERKTITFTGDTTGTWLTTTGVGIYLGFFFGGGATYTGGTSGTWGANAYIGTASNGTSLVTTLDATIKFALIQLEVGATASAFEALPQDVVTARCLRYFQRVNPGAITKQFGVGVCTTATDADIWVPFLATMRTTPTLGVTSTATDYAVRIASTGAIACNGVPTLNNTTVQGMQLAFSVASGLTAGHACEGYTNSSSGYLSFIAEL